MFPRDTATDQTFCPQCGEPCDDMPNTEAFEVFGEIMCADCAVTLFEAEGDE